MFRRNVALLTIILIAGALIFLAAPATLGTGALVYAGHAERPEICDDPAFTCQCVFTGGGWACFVTGPGVTPTPEPTPTPTPTDGLICLPYQGGVLCGPTQPTPTPEPTAPVSPAIQGDEDVLADSTKLPDTALQGE